MLLENDKKVGCLIKFAPSIYSETCKYRPPWRPIKCGPYTQVVFIYRFNAMKSIPHWALQYVGFINRWYLNTGGL